MKWKALSLALMTLSLLSAGTYALPQDTSAGLPTLVQWKEGDPGAGKFYVNGALAKSLGFNGVGVAVFGVWRFSKWLRISVLVENDRGPQVDVIPDTFTLDVTAPKPESLLYQSSEQLERSIRNRAKWGSVLAGAAAGAASGASTQTTTTSGDIQGQVSDNMGDSYPITGTVTTATTQTGNPEAGRAGGEAGDQVMQRARSRIDAVENTTLKSTTVFAGRFVVGEVYFKKPKQKSFKELVLRLPIGNCLYEFPLAYSPKSK